MHLLFFAKLSHGRPGSYVTLLLPPSPAILITLHRPLPFFSPLTHSNCNSKGKRASPSQRWLKWFFTESGQQPALVSVQRMHTTKNKLSAHSSAAGGNQADGKETKSSLHRAPWNSTARASSWNPRGKVWWGAGCVRTHEAFKLSTRKADRKVSAGRNTQSNFPRLLCLFIDSK